MKFLNDVEKTILFILFVLGLILLFFYEKVFALFQKTLQLVNMIAYYDSMREMDRSYGQIHAYLSNIIFLYFFVIILIVVLIAILIYYKSLIRVFKVDSHIINDLKIQLRLEIINLLIIVITMLSLLTNGTLGILPRILIFTGVSLLSILISRLVSNKLTNNISKRIRIYKKTSVMNQVEQDGNVEAIRIKFYNIYRISALILISTILILSIFSVKHYQKNRELPDKLYITEDTRLLNSDYIDKRRNPIICSNESKFGIYCFNDWYHDSEKRILNEYSLILIELELTEDHYQTYLDETMQLEVVYNGIQYKISSEMMAFEKSNGVWNLIIELKSVIPSSSYEELLILRSTFDLDVLYKDFTIVLEKIDK
jgi:hypothetical protein